MVGIHIGIFNLFHWVDVLTKLTFDLRPYAVSSNLMKLTITEMEEDYNPILEIIEPASEAGCL